MGLTAEVAFRIYQRYLNDSELNPGVDETPWEFSQRMTSGTGANQGTWIVRFQMQIVAGGATTVFLDGTSLNSVPDAFNNYVTLNRANFFAARNLSSTAGEYFFFVAVPQGIIEPGGPDNDSRLYAGEDIAAYSSVGLGTPGDQELAIQGGVGSTTAEIIMIGS